MTGALLLTAVLAPLAAALLTGIAGSRLPRQGGWLAVLGPLVSGATLIALAGAGPTTMTGAWFGVGGFELTLGLRLDGLSWWTGMLIAGVSTLVNLYALGYMTAEHGRQRFFATMAFFSGAMLVLVLSSSLLLLFAAWEAVGLASFVLIAHRAGEADARRAAARAFLMTRAGDMGLLMAWLSVLGLTGTTEIQSALEKLTDGTAAPDTLLVIALLFLAASIGKSAQLPLTAWLPDAMVGPTPVSALIHSATMVAAGVYLVLRLFPLFMAAGALEVVLWLGAITALVAAAVATTQADLKRVLAWSTVGHLGEMMVALGLGGPVAATFHLTTHAAFKSTLFLAAGVVQQATGVRDLRRLGGRLWRDLPWTAAAFLAAGLALAGIPPLSGFWSEETILRRAVARHPGWGLVMLTLIALAGIYIARAGVAAFGPWPGSRSVPVRPAGAAMRWPMVTLALGSVALGWLVGQPLERLLPFAPEEGRLAWTWRLAATGASAGGLAFGAWRVLTHGPVPALGAWPEVLARMLYAVPAAAARLARTLAASVDLAETSLAHAGDAVVTAARLTSFAVGVGERSLGRAFDVAGRGLEAAAVSTVIAEDSGLWTVNDRLAHRIGAIGASMRALETGRVYLYTAAVVAFVLAGGLLAVGGWLLGATAAPGLE